MKSNSWITQFLSANMLASFLLLAGSVVNAAVEGSPQAFIDYGGVFPEVEAPVNGFTFNDNSRWSSTATNGGGLGQGAPTTLTWSIIPDGTAISNQGVPASESSDASSLVAFLDGLMDPGSTGGADLTQRAWFPIFNTSFERFEELSGLTLTYESNDDGNANGGINNTSFPFGALGVRGDVRIGGHSIDGQAGSNVLAYNYFPNHGDMVIDTDNANFYNGNSVGFRNVVMHEHGHGLGISHVEPAPPNPDPGSQTKLMEPFISTQFEGPQVDDIQAIHRGYGDVYEKDNGGAGNDTNPITNATPIDSGSNPAPTGVVPIGTTVSIGTDANEPAGQIEVFPSESDFISIDDDADIDFLSFTINTAASVDLTLTPAGGPIYNQGPQNGTVGDETPFDPTSRSNLTLTLIDTNGVTPIATAPDNGLGSADFLTNQILLAGTYFARVTGSANFTQLYQLDVSAQIVPEPSTIAMLLLIGSFGLTQRRRSSR